MAYTIPQATRDQWHKLAQSAGLPYATIVGQHIYDLQGLIRVLEEEVQKATSAQPTSPTNSSITATTQHNATTTDLSPTQETVEASTANSTQVANDSPALHKDHSSAEAEVVSKLTHKLAVAKEQLVAYQLEQNLPS